MPKVICNRHGLESSILNLVINARDATPGGGVISAAAEVSQGADIKLVAADTRSGMTPQIIARALAPYFTTKTRDLVSGIGLSMVKHSTEESNYRVDIRSRPGIGMAATIRLPTAGPLQGAA